MVKNLPAMQETWVRSLGWEDSLEKRMATHSSILGLSWWFKKSKESTYNVGDLGSIPGLGRSPGGGHGNPLQYAYQEIPMDRGAMIHRNAESDTTEATLAHVKKTLQTKV